MFLTLSWSITIYNTHIFITYSQSEMLPQFTTMTVSKASLPDQSCLSLWVSCAVWPVAARATHPVLLLVLVLLPHWHHLLYNEKKTSLYTCYVHSPHDYCIFEVACAVSQKKGMSKTILPYCSVHLFIIFLFFSTLNL